MVLMVFCLSGIITVPILAIFAKPSILVAATGQKIKVEPAWVKFQISLTHWSYAQILFLAGFVNQGGLNRDATMELEDPLSTLWYYNVRYLSTLLYK
jgi:hypothetical protein